MEKKTKKISCIEEWKAKFWFKNEKKTHDIKELKAADVEWTVPDSPNIWVTHAHKHTLHTITCLPRNLYAESALFFVGNSHNEVPTDWISPQKFHKTEFLLFFHPHPNTPTQEVQPPPILWRNQSHTDTYLKINVPTFVDVMFVTATQTPHKPQRRLGTGDSLNHK